MLLLSAVHSAGAFGSAPAPDEECAGGKYSGSAGEARGRKCEDCVVGRFSRRGAKTCTTCPAGKHAAAAGAGACGACAAGQFSAFVYSGTAACALCPAGRFAPAGGTRSCTACAHVP